MKKVLIATSAVALTFALASSVFAVESKNWPTDKAAQVKANPEKVIYDPASAMEYYRSLDGEWNLVLDKQINEVSTGEKAPQAHVVPFKTIAAGSTVMQTYFRGTSYEMTIMYHQDGPDKLLADHFCAARNVPRMVFTPTDKPGVIRLKY